MAESMPTDLLTGEEILVNSTATATEGVCDNGCSNFGAFVGVSAISLFLVFLLEVPNIFITLRYDNAQYCDINHMHCIITDVLQRSRGHWHWVYNHLPSAS